MLYIEGMRLALPVLTVGLMVVLGTRADDGIAQTAQVEEPYAWSAEGRLSQATDLVLRALAYIGVRYRYGGDSPAAGFDCSGLVYRVFNQAAGLLLPRDSREMSRIGKRIPRTDLEPGDLVFFNTQREPFSHVGIYLGEQRFIHAPSRGGRVEIANMGREYWQKRYDGARRITTDPSY